ncbi:MAG: DUF6516 family protein [Bacteroidales bacterium]|nr:DUF6516 family protein [Bacteroidales bacterium]MCF8337502.1 DUF6516 family protein [Bacteroidales bacterium]
MIDEYFAYFDEVLAFTDFISLNQISKKRIDDYSGIIKGQLQFGEYQLDLIEVIFLFNNPEKKKKKYSYHFMDKNKSLIFRYDNAMHHPKLESFPHHKHTSKKVAESKEPDIQTVLKEIKDYLKDT